MPRQQDYEDLFSTLQRIVAEHPQQTPQLLAIILAGQPFRAVLERPEVLHKVVLLAKNYVRRRTTPAHPCLRQALRA